MEKTDTGYNIRTYDNGVLHFVMGRTYRAIGTCGEAKDKEVIGQIGFDDKFREYVLVTNQGIPCSINERTLSYL